MTYLEFLSLLVLYMAWVMLLLRMILADEASPDGEDPRDLGGYAGRRPSRRHGNVRPTPAGSREA